MTLLKGNKRALQFLYLIFISLYFCEQLYLRLPLLQYDKVRTELVMSQRANERRYKNRLKMKGRLVIICISAGKRYEQAS